MDIAQLAQNRHTCKAYDPARKISSEKIDQLKTLLRFAPSSVNSQPWHFVFASSESGKQRFANAMAHPVFSANAAKVASASHVVALCARTTIDDDHITAVLDSEEQAGRFPKADSREIQKKSRYYYVNLHRFDLRDTQQWMEKQVYLALGTLLLGAVALEIDATPIEGFDPAILNKELGLREKGLTSVVVVALGYRSADDFNADLPKARLPAETIISEI